MSPAAGQLPLDLPHSPAMSRGDFLAGEGNRRALGLIERWPDWPAPVVLLSGPAGSGKSHLVEIWRERSGAARVAAADLSGADPGGILAAGAAAVEDLDRAPGAEAALFHLLNAAREAGAALLLTSRLSAEALAPRLPDLASRLRAAAPAALAAPDDDLLARLLVKLFADRQIVPDPALLDYVLKRIERSFAAAAAAVAALDAEALAAGRPITRALAAAVLPRLGEGDP